MVESLEAVHTHTHTHTQVFYYERRQKLFNQLFCFLEGKESEQLSTLRDSG